MNATTMLGQAKTMVQDDIFLLFYAPVDGFIASVPPFNFIAIASNLTYTHYVMGNVTHLGLKCFVCSRV